MFDSPRHAELQAAIGGAQSLEARSSALELGLYSHACENRRAATGSSISDRDIFPCEHCCRRSHSERQAQAPSYQLHLLQLALARVGRVSRLHRSTRAGTVLVSSWWGARESVAHVGRSATNSLQDVAQEQGIKAMPTFKAYKDGQVIDEFTGAVPAKLTVSTSFLVQFQRWPAQSRRPRDGGRGRVCSRG